MNYEGIDSLLNTTEGMEYIRNNVKQDDGTDIINGAEWFKFNGIEAKSIYASGNCWIGIGANAENLKICRRDGAMWYLLRQEGTLYGYYKFIKIRWEGYTNYGGTDESYSLKFELFLFNTGDMFVNVIKTPNSSSYVGTSEFVCNGVTQKLTIGAGTTPMITFTHLDDLGKTWEISYEKIDIKQPFEMKFLIKNIDGYYTYTTEGVQKIEIETLTAQTFREFGADTVPAGRILLGLVNPKILFWQDSQEALAQISAQVEAVPKTQTVNTIIQDMSDITIANIQSVTIDAQGNVKFAFSFGGSSWRVISGGVWEDAGENGGMTKEEVEGITEEQWITEIGDTRSYQVRFLLEEGSALTSITVNYKNQEGIQ